MAQAWTRWRQAPLLAAIMALGFTGCTTLEGVPARFVPPPLLGERRADREDIDLVRLRQDPPPEYLLDARDILGIYIEGVLGDAEKAPPVSYPEDGNSPPSIGFPIPVREDGTVALPLVDPVDVKGKSLAEAENLIRRQYTEVRKILKPGQDRIIVTLVRKRTYQVLVVRGDTAAPIQSTKAGDTGTGRSSGFVVNLKAYENDVLHALMETGGMPGFEAENEVIIFRGAFKDGATRDAKLAELAADADPCTCDDRKRDFEDDEQVVQIPLRLKPGEVIDFKQDDIILKTGDVVKIVSRERDVFYTGGVLPGAQIPLPRDYDLDVLGAIALTGNSFGGPGQGSAFGRGGGGNGGNLAGIIPPTDITILRQPLDCPSEQVIIKIRLHRALKSRSERILIQPNDIVLLNYTPLEAAANIALSVINFQFLVGQAFQQR